MDLGTETLHDILYLPLGLPYQNCQNYNRSYNISVTISDAYKNVRRLD